MVKGLYYRSFIRNSNLINILESLLAYIMTQGFFFLSLLTIYYKNSNIKQNEGKEMYKLKFWILIEKFRNKRGGFTVESIIVVSWSIVLISLFLLAYLRIFINFFSITDTSLKLKMESGEIPIERKESLLFNEREILVLKSKERFVRTKEIKYLDVFNYYLIIEEMGGNINEFIKDIEE